MNRLTYPAFGKSTPLNQKKMSSTEHSPSLRFAGNDKPSGFYSKGHRDLKAEKETKTIEKKVEREVSKEVVDYERTFLDMRQTHSRFQQDMLKFQAERDLHHQKMLDYVQKKTAHDFSSVIAGQARKKKETAHNVKDKGGWLASIGTGIAASASVGFTDFGVMGVAAALYTKLGTELVGDALVERVYKVPDILESPREVGLAPKLPKGHEQPETHYKTVIELKTFTEKVEEDNPAYHEGRQQLAFFKEFASKRLPEVKDGDALKPDEVEMIVKGFESPFNEVQALHASILNDLRKKSGVYSKIKLKSALPEGVHNFIKEGLKHNIETVNNPKSSIPDTVDAINALYKQEFEINTNYTNSERIYPTLFKHPDPKIKKAALAAMANERLIRPRDEKEYHQMIEEAILSSDSDLKQIAMRAMQASPFFSRFVNKELEKIVTQEKEQSPLSTLAYVTLQHLNMHKLYTPFHPEAIAASVASTFINNPYLEEDLSTVLMDFKTHTGEHGPNVIIYTHGKPGIGKTFLQKNLAEKALGPDSFVRIHLGLVSTREAIEAKLRAAGELDSGTGKISLANRMVFFDEAHELDKIESPEVMKGVRDFFKPIFDKSEHSVFNFKDAMVSFASNMHLPTTATFGQTVEDKKANGVTETAKANLAVYQRLKENSIEIKLNDDSLDKEGIEQLIDRWDTEQLWSDCTEVNYSNVSLTDAAKKQIKTTLVPRLKRDPDGVTGRNVVKAMNTLIHRTMNAPDTKGTFKAGVLYCTIDFNTSSGQLEAKLSTTKQESKTSSVTDSLLSSVASLFKR